MDNGTFFSSLPVLLLSGPKKFSNKANPEVRPNAGDIMRQSHKYQNVLLIT